MTIGKLKVLSAAALIAVAGAVQAAVSQPRHITIEYEYAKDGEIVSRKVNGAVQRYEYDLRGQLTGVYDGDGKAVEAYQYDAAGNILKKTVNGKTTTFKYDAANQLVSKEDDAGLVTYAYDAAGRMVREGDKEYRYSYLDKITSVLENGETAATMDYFVGGQIASVTRGNEAEQFIWDGLALVHRDGSDYLNEPAIGGGNPIASNGKVMLNDMLGSTVAVKGDEGYSTTSMTAFGESSDTGAFFTGKPFVGELGYAFLMRSYRPENGKWQTADPVGYPDGWNQLAYCNNGVTSCVDLWGCIEFKFDEAFDFSSSSGNVLNQNTDYRISLTDTLQSHTADSWSSSISLGLYAESHLQTGMLDGSGSMVYMNSGSARSWTTMLTYTSTGNDSYRKSSTKGFGNTITNPFRVGYSFTATYSESITWNQSPSENGYTYGTMFLTFSAGSATFGDKEDNLTASFNPSSQIVVNVSVRKE